MGEQRNLTAGISFRVEEAVNSIDEVTESLGGVADGAQEAEKAMARVGSRAAESAGAVSAGFREAGNGVDTFGSAVARGAGESLKKYNSLPKAIKAGVDGGLGYAEKKADSFFKKVVTGAGRMGKAFLHPVQAIKGKLAGALDSAGAETEGVGAKAEDAGHDLKGRGDKGEDAGNSIKDALGGVAAKLVALKAGIEIIKAGLQSVKDLGAALLEAGKSTQEANAKFAAVFEDKAVGEWAENFAGAVKRSQSEVKSFLVSNRAVYQEMGLAGKAADELSKITTSVAYDIGAALKIDDGEALSAVQDYIKGNTAALSQYGVQIDDTMLKQAAASMGYRKSIEDLSDAELAQVRMNALLENSTSIQRQAAEGQEGYANNIKGLKAAITDFGEKAASKLSPLFDKITGNFLKSWPKIEAPLLKFIDYLGSGGVGAALPALADMAATALPPFIDMLSQAFAAAEPLGGVLMGFATTALPPLVKALAPAVSMLGELAGTVLPPLGSIIGKIAENILPPLAKAVGTFNRTVIEPLMPVISSIADAILPALAAGLQAISPLLELISPALETIGTVLGKVVGFLGKVVEYAAGGIGTLIDKVAGFFGGGGGSPGADIPHNASGTEHFAGGMTYINERGGEMAILPSGSKIIPADKSQALIEGASGKGAPPVNVNINIELKGEVDEKVLDGLEERIRRIAEKAGEEVYRKMKEAEMEKEAIQEGLA